MLLALYKRKLCLTQDLDARLDVRMDVGTFRYSSSPGNTGSNRQLLCCAVLPPVPESGPWPRATLTCSPEELSPRMLMVESCSVSFTLVGHTEGRKDTYQQMWTFGGSEWAVRGCAIIQGSEREQLCRALESGLWHWERTNAPSFKPLSLWGFVALDLKWTQNYCVELSTWAQCNHLSL